MPFVNIFFTKTLFLKIDESERFIKIKTAAKKAAAIAKNSIFAPFFTKIISSKE